MHAHSHMESMLFKNFLLHSNSLIYLGALMNELSVTGGYSSFVSFIAYFTLFVLILMLTIFDSLSSEEHSLAITLFISSCSYNRYAVSFSLLLFLFIRSFP